MKIFDAWTAPRYLAGIVFFATTGGSIQAQTYWPPRDRAHLFECQTTVLTRRMALDSEQMALIHQAIEVFYDTDSAKVRTSAEARRRRTVRDSTIRTILRTKEDSAAFKRNVDGEQQWWSSGACNGTPETRPYRRPPMRE